MNETSANGIHTPNGKFAAGNPGGPGNPHGGQVARLRAVMLEAVSEDDMRAVVLKLVELAKEGDLKAIDPNAREGRWRAAGGCPDEPASERAGGVSGASGCHLRAAAGGKGGSSRRARLPDHSGTDTGGP